MTRREYVLKPFEQARDYMEQRVAEGVERHRKGELHVRVVDADGRPVTGASVRMRQTGHQFLSGANLFMLDELETPEKNELYKQYFKDCFNLATLPFYWCDLEPEQGKPRFAKDSPKVYRRPAPDLCLDYCEQNGVTPKLHCLNYDQWTPHWVPQRVEDVKRLLEKRFREIAVRYKDRIHGIEVINETLCGTVADAIRKSTPFFDDDELIEWSFACARKYFPGNELIINEATQFVWSEFHKNRGAYSLLIERALDKGHEIDAIGMQFHMFYRREMEQLMACPYYDPHRLYDVMDYYHERFHKPAQITEITIPAYSADADDEALQAEIIQNLYGIWFSHPSVEAAVYWNLVDGYAAFAPQGDMASGENYYYGGLVRFDFTKKPAYEALIELFQHRWHTDATAATDGDGRACVRGFYGDYDVVVTKNGHGTVHKAKLHKGAEGAIRIALTGDGR